LIPPKLHHSSVSHLPAGKAATARPAQSSATAYQPKIADAPDFSYSDDMVRDRPTLDVALTLGLAPLLWRECNRQVAEHVGSACRLCLDPVPGAVPSGLVERQELEPAALHLRTYSSAHCAAHDRHRRNVHRLRESPLVDAVAIAFVMPFFMLILGKFILE
jgi:hypothetical protein